VSCFYFRRAGQTRNFSDQTLTNIQRPSCPKMLTAIPKVISIIDRLHAAYKLVSLVQIVMPRLVSAGTMSQSAADMMVDQIGGIGSQIEQRIDSLSASIDQIQDRVETLGQFLLLHRDALTAGEIREVEKQMIAVKG
jgi:hypothetical protein